MVFGGSSLLSVGNGQVEFAGSEVKHGDEILDRAEAAGLAFDDTLPPPPPASPCAPISGFSTPCFSTSDTFPVMNIADPRVSAGFVDFTLKVLAWATHVLRDIRISEPANDAAIPRAAGASAQRWRLRGVHNGAPYTSPFWTIFPSS